jgi:predicted metal-dependent peptidase
MATAEEKLMAARCRLMSTAPWYGHMALMMDWGEALNSMPGMNMKTMYVTTRSGRIWCKWFREFVDGRTVEELYGCIQHEIEHILRLHLTRAMDGSKHQIVWNLATDMCVNGRKNKPRVGYTHGREYVGPLGPDSEKALIWIPEDWPDDETAEFYYDKIQKDGNMMKLVNAMAAGTSSIGTLDDHGAWAGSDMSPDEMRQLVSDMVHEATNRSMGQVPGHLASVLEALNKPLVSWRELLKRYLGRHVGNRRKTYCRRSRRRDSFGVPGVSHHAAARVSIVVDTSGSISDDDLKQFFGEIESISYRAKVCVLQWDHDFQGFEPNYRKGSWRRIEVHGRGGTDMRAPVEWLYERGLIGDCCIMLTDGYCNYTEPKPFPMITCICAEGGSEPDWGHVIKFKSNNYSETINAA